MTDESLTDDSVHVLTGAYALNALSEDERAIFAQHLDECDSCAAETAELIATAAGLALLVQESPPAHLRATVLREITQTAQLPRVPATDSDTVTESATVVDLDARRSRRRRVVIAVGGALAAAAAIAGAVFLLGDNGDPIDDILAATDARTITGEVAGGGQATLVVSDSLDGGVIKFADLPEPGPGQAYQMWLITGDAAPMPEETFEPSGTGSASVLLEGAPDVDAVAVTIEPDTGSTTPTLPILAIIEVGA